MWLEIDQVAAVIIGVPKDKNGEEDWSAVYLHPLEEVLATNPQKADTGRSWTGLMNRDLEPEDAPLYPITAETAIRLNRWCEMRYPDGSPKFIITAKFRATSRTIKFGRVKTHNLINRGLVTHEDVQYLMFLEQHSHELALYELEQAKAKAEAQQAKVEVQQAEIAVEKRRHQRDKEQNKQRRQARRRRQRELDDALLEQRAW